MNVLRCWSASWQRWYLDGVGLAIALAAYGYSWYLTNASVLSPALNVQVNAPLVLTATICLVLTCTLFLLRLFPLLLRLDTKLAMLVVLVVLAVALMNRSVSRIILGQTLRLNED